jgi:hypothetical protein
MMGAGDTDQKTSPGNKSHSLAEYRISRARSPMTPIIVIRRSVEASLPRGAKQPFPACPASK